MAYDKTNTTDSLKTTVFIFQFNAPFLQTK